MPMNNEEDWKEIEQWAERQENNKMDLYKIDINDEKIKQNAEKTTRKSLKILNIIGKIILTGIILIILFLIFRVIVLWSVSLSNINRLKVDVERSVKWYDKNAVLISKDVDKDENGKYIYKINDDRNIIFYAVKNDNNLSVDYFRRCHKYYFENWKSEDKDDIVVEEKEDENGILSVYNTYIELESYSEIEQDIKKINSFREYCKDKFRLEWNIYLKKGETRIYPYNSSNIENITLEETVKYVQEKYKEKWES